ncbi:MAG: 1-acyl-sn-glycerol-3-phosphate acyltransferase [Chlamydiales bacterium]|nr:1-acyl-sn-glycerol-3-phosphate acyltransferase [Chlamydiales bacterium]
MEFETKLAQYEQDGVLTPRQGHILRQFYGSYLAAYREKGIALTESPAVTMQFLDLIIKQIKTPYPFQAYHEKVTSPDNYLKFGLEMIRPLIDFNRSVLLGEENIAEIDAQLKQGHNCILYANHQTEPDPQAIHLLLERTHPELATNILMVAGDRVISDPIAVPFSKGRNMLCIYSRKHMDHPPEKKADKLNHNRRALKALVQQLTKGGVCVYIAPSGGRDRPNSQGVVEVAPFERDAIDLFALMAQESKTPTHFYPLSLATYRLLPPPKVVEKEIGEDREFNYTPIGVAFGKEIDMTYGRDNPGLDKKAQRQLRCDYIYAQVCDGYRQLLARM